MLHFFFVEHVCENSIQASLLSPMYKMGNHNSATKTCQFINIKCPESKSCAIGLFYDLLDIYIYIYVC